MATFTLTCIGDDRPGLVSALSAPIKAHGGSWERSQMSRLAGKFAGILMVAVPDERADALAANRSAARASARSSGTATMRMPANLPASRDIWLRSQLPPWALMGAERADTSPGRSSPIQVRVKVAMGAGYEMRARRGDP